MKTLGSSNFKFSPWKYREKFTSRSKKESIFIGHPKHYLRVGLSLAVSLQYSNNSAVSSALPSSNTQVTDESEKIQINNQDPQPKTVHVRFKLQKECAFGQQFLLVGDDPVIGLWDPSDGVPLIWSDGHLWTAELDIPIGKVIKYKFLLKGETGTILWQPGPDRILETTRDTEKTINVFEDWDNPKLKNTVEEEDEPLLFDLNENLNEQTKKVNDKELMNNSPNGVIISKREEEGILINGDRGADVNAAIGNLLLISEKETRAVLVPGLFRMAIEEEEETLLNEGETENLESSCSGSSTSSDDKIDEELSTVVDQSKDAEYMPAASFLHPPKEIIEEIWDEDMQWGRRTIQKFLSSFGFKI